MARPKKVAKYTKIIPIRFSPDTYLKIQNQANKERLEPSTWIRKKICDVLNKK